VAAGATGLAVATVDEGTCLRDEGIEAPVLVLSEPAASAMDEVVASGLTATLYSHRGVAALDAAARAAGAVVGVHVKVDTGMHRVGVDPAGLAPLVAAVGRADGLRLGALGSHLADAESDDPDDRSFTALQVQRFDEACAEVAASGAVVPLQHLANSAGAIVHPSARRDLVRCGLALYGEAPSPWVADAVDRSVARADGADGVARADGVVTAGRAGLRPVLSLRSRVSLVRCLAAGERPSYGRRRALAEASTVVTVPLGYADGVPRRYFDGGGTVLVGGRRCPLAGTVTMDQIVVDCGPGAEVSRGDDVVLIGSQGNETISAGSWADVLGTISYEVLCGIGPRVPRVVVDSGEDDGETGHGREARP